MATRLALLGLLAGLAATAGGEPVRAFLSTASLAGMCTGAVSEDLHAYTHCTGYLSGILDGHSAPAGRAQALRVCRPDGLLTVEQLRLVFVRYVGARPERLTEAASVVALDALALAWPCPGESTRSE